MEVLDPPRDEFDEVVNYSYYCLKISSDKYDGSITGRLCRTERGMAHSFRAEYFSGKDPVEIHEFLQNFQVAADQNGVGEGAAAKLLPSFMDDPAGAEIRGNLSRWERERKSASPIPLYPRAMAWLLKRYAKPRVLRDAYQGVVTLTQGEAETEQEFASRIRTAANRAGDVFTDKALVNVYLDGLNAGVSCLLMDSKTPSTSFADLEARAINAGRALGAAAGTDKSEKSKAPTPRPWAAKCSSLRSSKRHPNYLTGSESIPVGVPETVAEEPPRMAT